MNIGDNYVHCKKENNNLIELLLLLLHTYYIYLYNCKREIQILL